MSMSRSVLRLSLLLAGALILRSEAVVINLPGLGPIEGSIAQTLWTGRTIYQYRGIPFAEPPVGDLRWKRPVKKTTPWEGILDCSQYGPVCPQAFIIDYPNLFSHVTVEDVQSEDCLSLNVFSNKLTDGGIGTGRPVMVFFHGGIFLAGSANFYDPLYLLEKDVILVVPQYRLGPLGFLSLKNEDMPGNQAMLDVILALEWVRDNIEHFGGDPSRVTVFGESAGGAAVTSLLFSPLVEEGLFHQMICQSGSVLGTWVSDAEPVVHTKAIALLAGCVSNDDQQLATCLRNKTPKQIINAHNRYMAADFAAGGRLIGGHHMVWDEAGDKSFMRKNPAELFESGNFRKIPLMAGVTKHEGTLFMDLAYSLLFKPFNLTHNEDYMSRTVTRRMLEYGGIEDPTGYTATFTRDQYFPKEQRGNFTAMSEGIVDILGVTFLKASTYILASENSFDRDTYLYSFNYWGEHSIFNSPSPNRPYDYGIGHAHELPFLFNIGFKLNEKDTVVAKHMVDLWTSFAINGKPVASGVPEWPPMSSAEGPYLKFDETHGVYDNFVDEEYMIAVKEGLKPESKR